MLKQRNSNKIFFVVLFTFFLSVFSFQTFAQKSNCIVNGKETFCETIDGVMDLTDGKVFNYQDLSENKSESDLDSLDSFKSECILNGKEVSCEDTVFDSLNLHYSDNVNDEGFHNDESTSSCSVNGEPVPCDEAIDQIKSTLAFGGIIILFFIILGICSLIFWIAMLIHAIKHDFKDRVLWIVLMVIFGILASIIYYFAVKRSFRKRKNDIPQVDEIISGQSNSHGQNGD